MLKALLAMGNRDFEARNDKMKLMMWTNMVNYTLRSRARSKNTIAGTLYWLSSSY